MAFLEASLRIATPLMLAALGGLLSESAGVFAVGLEGMMLSGAFAAVLGLAHTGSILAACLAAVVAGGAAAACVALAAIVFRADGMVTGLSANILALGVTSSALHFDPDAAASFRPLASHPLTWLAVLLPVPIAWFLRHTGAGLALRATGENPAAVRAAGLRPRGIRAAAVLACGALAGLGGAVLPLQQVGAFTDDMTGGRGYLALAALIVGRWTCGGTIAACFAFGAAEALELRLEAAGSGTNPYLLQMLPYALALAVLAALGRSARLPAALGKPI